MDGFGRDFGPMPELQYEADNEHNQCPQRMHPDERAPHARVQREQLERHRDEEEHHLARPNNKLPARRMPSIPNDQIVHLLEDLLRDAIERDGRMLRTTVNHLQRGRTPSGPVVQRHAVIADACDGEHGRAVAAFFELLWRRRRGRHAAQL